MATTAYEPQAFHDGLVAHNLIIPSGVDGVFGRGHVFEDVLDRLNDAISQIASNDGAQTCTFPPVIARKILEDVEYMESFPHLAGTIHSFFGKTDKQAKELQAAMKSGAPWAQLMGLTDCVMNPAACYPLYPTLRGALPDDGKLVSFTGWVFRHEPSIEPTRMQSFRVREFVRAGTPDMVVAWRDQWLERGMQLLTELGLPAKSDVAADPFFGRGGKMMADGQKAQKLKFEVLIPVISESAPTACCSFNYHQDKFGAAFDITIGGETAHTACLGFGLERCVMALFQAHGFNPDNWPTQVHDRLWVS
jgi:seryl-tRNA synthetase